MGRLYLRYQSKFGFAERWAAAEISQSVRVLPDLEQYVLTSKKKKHGQLLCLEVDAIYLDFGDVFDKVPKAKVP